MTPAVFRRVCNSDKLAIAKVQFYDFLHSLILFPISSFPVRSLRGWSLLYASLSWRPHLTPASVVVPNGSQSMYIASLVLKGGLGVLTTDRRFPPVRACIFDMDGLLIDSEDAYTLVTNTILRENGRPELPWHIKAQLQGRPGPAAGKIFHAWAQLPITHDEFMKRQVELQAEAFKNCKPLPGVENLLNRLKTAHVDYRRSQNPATTRPSLTARSPMSPSPAAGKTKIQLALATSSHARNYEIKTARLRELFDVFPERHRILGDDARIPPGRGKPLPDIYLLALQAINETVALAEDTKPIEPRECLVFEDSVPGVEAARRAGMRVVWCPHPGLREVYAGREEEVLAGRTGEHNEDDLDHTAGIPLAGSPGHVGEIGDGWAELLDTLEDFDFAKYGITLSDTRYTSENGQPAVDGTTDKELEEMTALADGKRHAPEEPSPPPYTPVPHLS